MYDTHSCSLASQCACLLRAYGLYQLLAMHSTNNWCSGFWIFLSEFIGLLGESTYLKYSVNRISFTGVKYRGIDLYNTAK